MDDALLRVLITDMDTRGIARDLDRIPRSRGAAGRNAGDDVLAVGRVLLPVEGQVEAYEAIHELGSETAVKEAGKLRTEGKGYYPKDGDIMFFKFNVSRGK